MKSVSMLHTKERINFSFLQFHLLKQLHFYLNIGCEDVKDIISEYIDTENDRYLEYPLTT